MTGFAPLDFLAEPENQEQLVRAPGCLSYLKLQPYWPLLYTGPWAWKGENPSAS